MNRALTFILAPEAVFAALTGAVYLFCARHHSYGNDDVRALERLMWLLPVVAVGVAFATMYMSGVRTWWWLGRLNLALLVCLVASALLIVDGFGAPGSGPKGQDAGLILVISFGICFSAIGNAFASAAILRAQRPSWEEWFQLRPVLGHALTAVASIPVGIVQLVASCIVLGIAAAGYSAFKR